MTTERIRRLDFKIRQLLNEISKDKNINVDIVRLVRQTFGDLVEYQEKYAEQIDNLEDEIKITGGILNETLKKIIEGRREVGKTLDNYYTNIRNFRNINYEFLSTNKSLQSYLGDLNETMNIYAPDMPALAKNMINIAGFFYKYVDDFRLLSKYGLQVSDIFFALDRSMYSFMTSYDETVSLILENAALAQEMSLSSLNEFVNRVHFSSQKLYRFGFLFPQITRLTIDFLETQRLLMSHDEMMENITAKQVSEFIESIYKASVNTGIEVERIARSLREMANDPSLRFTLTMIPQNSRETLAILREALPSIFPILNEAIQKGFSIYRVDNFADIQLAGLEKTLQEWLDDLRNGTFDFRKRFSEMRDNLERYNERAALLMFRQQEGAGRLLSSLAIEINKTNEAIPDDKDAELTAQTMTTMANIQLNITNFYRKSLEALTRIMFSPEFDEFLANIVKLVPDVSQTSADTEEKLEKYEELAAKIGEQKFSPDMEDVKGKVSQFYSKENMFKFADILFGSAFVGTFIWFRRKFLKIPSEIDIPSLGRNFIGITNAFADKISNIVSTLKSVFQKTVSLVTKGLSPISKGVKALPRKTGAIKKGVKYAEKLLKIRLGPAALILSSFDYWMDLVDAYNRYLNGEIDERQLKMEFARVVGKAAGGLGGAAMLGALGGAFGSAIPLVGNVGGAIAGGTIGLFGGEYIGEYLGEKIGEYVLGEKTPSLPAMSEIVPSPTEEIQPIEEMAGSFVAMPVSSPYEIAEKLSNIERQMKTLKEKVENLPIDNERARELRRELMRMRSPNQ